MLLGGGACADDAPTQPTTSDTEDGTSSTGDEPPITTIDPDTTVGTDEDTTRGETTEGETTEGETTVVDTTEGETTEGAVCGNGTIEDREQCDTDDLDGEDCVTQGFAGGDLGCADDCTFDTSSCTARTCGNGMIEGTEDCDGADLGGESCQTQGFAGGNLACAGDCSFDTSGCTNLACGNGVIDMGETCDGAALGGQTCETQGFPGGGVLGCAADCLGYDTSGCIGGGGGDCCAAHAGTGCDDPACEAAICGADPFCCDTQWDDICANAAIASPACQGVGGSCPVAGACGNGAIDPGESCDGANLNGQTCVSLGFAGGGVLTCTAGCGFDTSGCIGGGGGDCCAAHAGTGCDDATCEATICAADPFCCDTQWDDICANAAIASPACQGVGGSCPGGGGGFACQDQDLGSAMGAAVASGNTALSDNDLNPSCGAGDALDEVLRFVAPAAGQYTFSTAGSTYDTILALFSDCATQLACNDDANGTLQSQLVRNMAAGEVVLILVDGYNGATGDWVLNITSP
jgi:hypothetical protein